tara:strand:- start:2047 stop:2442 length:396 start_codon:yes stop_codon:yes gene_type:complete
MLSFGLLLLSALSNVVRLPPVNNIYIATVNVPVIGKQNIEYERQSELKSEIRMSGIINDVAYINYNLVSNNSNKLYEYELDNNLIRILKKYRCELSNPSYTPFTDIASIEILVRLINFKKIIILKNKEALL